MVRNISPNGASISDLEIPSHTIPTTPFQVGLSIEEGSLKGIQTTCSMTRFSNNGRISMGLKFDRIGEKHQAILRNFVRPYTRKVNGLN